jgi:hypothetical protein
MGRSLPWNLRFKSSRQVSELVLGWPGDRAALRRLSELDGSITALATAYAALRVGGLACLRWQLTM